MAKFPLLCVILAQFWRNSKTCGFRHFLRNFCGTEPQKAPVQGPQHRNPLHRTALLTASRAAQRRPPARARAALPNARRADSACPGGDLSRARARAGNRSDLRAFFMQGICCIFRLLVSQRFYLKSNFRVKLSESSRTFE